MSKNIRIISFSKILEIENRTLLSSTNTDITTDMVTNAEDPVSNFCLPSNGPRSRDYNSWRFDSIWLTGLKGPGYAMAEIYNMYVNIYIKKRQRLLLVV